MAEQVRSRQLQQQVAALTQRENAQRCVAAFLGSNEDMLRVEVESLKQVPAFSRACMYQMPVLLRGLDLARASSPMADLCIRVYSSRTTGSMYSMGMHCHALLMKLLCAKRTAILLCRNASS